VERSKIKDRNNDSKTKTAYRLFSGKDSNKDQSYFLWTLTQAQLRHTLFPIGRYTKPEVRALARKFGLPNAEKKDSQGICFLGVVKLEDFLAQYIPPHAGVVLNTTGAVIGTHRGAAYYTIGQRHGLGVALGSPVYVAAKDVRANTLTVAAGEDSALSRRAVTLADVHFIRPVSPRPSQQIFVSARVRYRQPLQEAVFNARTGVLVFTTPVKFVAPGQSAVLYTSAGEVLGGGIIV
jgi:tRNA-specific 2-thiouridylase